jgi:hypothetical protein
VSSPDLPGDEAGQRPFPDPEHSIAPRRPRTPGGVAYLGVLVATLAGVGVVVLGPWRLGLVLAGAALVFGATVRLALRDDAAGMLGVRRKLVDVLTLAALGGGLVVLAVVIPDQPRP